MAIPANRLAAMRESDERTTSIFHTLPARPTAFYVCLVIIIIIIIILYFASVWGSMGRIEDKAET